MEPQQNPVDKYNIKSESVEKASNNEIVQDANLQGTSDFDEVSPSATDEGTNELWSALSCVFCKKAAIRFEEVRLLECLHSACVSCINSRRNDDECNARSNYKLIDLPTTVISRAFCIRNWRDRFVWLQMVFCVNYATYRRARRWKITSWSNVLYRAPRRMRNPTATVLD